MRSRWSNYGGDTIREGFPSSDEKLLHVYDALRREIIQQQKSQTRRSIRGAVIIGAIIGYAALSGVDFVIGFIPIVLTYLFAETVETHMNIATLAEQVAEIEEVLSEPDSPFRYEHQRGVGSEERGHFFVLNSLPAITKISVSIFVYIVSIYYTYASVWPSAGVDIGDFIINRTLILYGYGVLTLFIFMSALIFVYNSKTVRDRVNNKCQSAIHLVSQQRVAQKDNKDGQGER